ncbi:MAG: MaoC family dehydratase [Pseudomonadales bacterium]|nr:MaoC family dehydratase [Pseudomonadales bacterium]
MKIVPADSLKDYIGKELGKGEWLEINQDRIDQFADVTEDHQFIHVDPDAAKPLFGGTIAHGFLTLSLMVKLAQSVEGDVVPEGVKMGMNYGFDKVRFVNPVRSGKRVRTCTKMKSVDYKEGGRILVNVEHTVEIEGEEKPAIVADWLTMFFT